MIGAQRHTSLTDLVARPARPPRLLAALLAGLAALVLAAPAQAQTVTTFISNTGQTTNTASNLIRATSFTTGAGTYTLTSVVIHTTTNTNTTPQGGCPSSC